MKHQRYFITKWFITIGIVEAPGIPNEGSDYISVKVPGRRLSNSMRLGRDVFERKEEAEVRGRILLRNEIINTGKYMTRLQKKLASMEGQLVDMEDDAAKKIFGVYQTGSAETDGWIVDSRTGKVWVGTRIEAYSHAEKLGKKRPQGFLNFSVDKLSEEQLAALNGS